jgi:NDP-sugar pyrophosphorylase family protein
LIRSAVVLAAGRGKRMGPLTESTPKPLIEVAGRSLLERLLSGLRTAGIERASVVTGYRAEALERAALAMDAPELVFLRQPRPLGTGHAIRLARDFAGEAPFFFGWSDIVVEPANYARVLDAFAGDATLAVNAIDDPCEGAAVYVDEHRQITRIVEKPPRGTSTTPWNSAGFGVLGPAIWPALEAIHPSPRGEYELADALSRLLTEGRSLLAVPVVGPWHDVGTPERLAEAEAGFAGRA